MTKEQSLYEQIGGTYIEKDGVLYPNLSMEQEQAKQTAEEEVYETVIYRFY